VEVIESPDQQTERIHGTSFSLRGIVSGGGLESRKGDGITLACDFNFDLDLEVNKAKGWMADERNSACRESVLHSPWESFQHHPQFQAREILLLP
jgi:hypothetical protein